MIQVEDSLPIVEVKKLHLLAFDQISLCIMYNLFPPLICKWYNILFPPADPIFIIWRNFCYL